MTLSKNKNAIAAAFCLAVSGTTLYAEAEDVIPYKSMGDADIYIPVKEYKPLSDDTLLIKISDRKINPFSYLFSKTSAFSADGYNKNRHCPYVKFKDKDYSIKRIGRHDFEITAKISAELQKQLKKSGCIITPTPPLSKIPGR